MPSSFTNLVYHVVFSTKNRKPLIHGDLREQLYKYIGGIIRNKRGALLEIGGISDHVHLVAKFRADVSVAQMLQHIKANSSKWANEQPKRPARFAWQTGYSAFSVSESQIEKVRTYVRNQERHHRRVSFQDEFRALLRKHGIEFDETYLWS